MGPPDPNRHTWGRETTSKSCTYPGPHVTPMIQPPSMDVIVVLIQLMSCDSYNWNPVPPRFQPTMVVVLLSLDCCWGKCSMWTVYTFTVWWPGNYHKPGGTLFVFRGLRWWLPWYVCSFQFWRCLSLDGSHWQPISTIPFGLTTPIWAVVTPPLLADYRVYLIPAICAWWLIVIDHG